MLGFLYKDLKVCKGTFIALLIALMISNGFILLPYFAGAEEFTDTMNDSPQFWVMMCIFAVGISFYVGGMLQESLISVDERKKWAYFVVSTEDGIKREVGSKYIMMILYSMMTAFVCVFMNALTSDIVGGDVPPTMGLIMVLFFVQLMLRAISVPFIIAFSSKYGNTVRLSIFIAVMVSAVVYGLFGDLSWIDLESIWDKAFQLLKNMNDSTGLIWGQIVFFSAVAVLYYLSYRISCKFYLKGVEHYDK